MNTGMRNILRALVLCPLVFLSVPGLPAAAEVQDDEKIVMPRPQPHGVAPSPAVPESPGAVIIVPSPVRPSPGPGGTQALPPALPGETPSPETGVAPRPSGEEPSGGTPFVVVPVVPAPPGAVPAETPAVPVVPVLPENTPPVEIPAVPVPPGATPAETPAVPVTPPPPRPEESAPRRAVIIPPAGTEPEKAAPEKGTPDKPASPLDFLLKPTPLAPEKENPDKAADEPGAEKGKQPAEPVPGDPPKKTPLKKDPPKKTPLKAEKAKPGTPLRIPPDAARSGDLSFLEGCWRGTRPEYTTKRIITERFCFDKNGSGKRTIDDPAYAGKCTGATKGSFDAQGRLVVTSEQGYCSGGPTWGPAYMVCEGEGESTPCFWRFPAAGGGSQQYKIPLVRE